MQNSKKIETMLSEISANIEQLEQELREEYKRLIRVSSEFADFSVEFVLLERKSLPPAVKEYETSTIVDRLCTRLDATFAPARDKILILEAAMAVMQENTSAAAISRN